MDGKGGGDLAIVRKRDTEFQSNLQDVSVQAKLVASWLEDCIEPNTHITIPTPGGEYPFQCMQFLSAQSSIKVLPSFRGDGDTMRCWNVQPFTVFQHQMGRVLEENPSTFDAFSFSVPASFNLFKYIAEVNPNRCNFLQWDTQLSDIQGCIELHSSSNLVPRSALQSAKVSVLALKDALEDQLYVAVNRTVDHYNRQGKFFDASNLQSRRCYLQCVLASTWLYANGQKQFPSNRPQAYYLAIMRKPGQVDVKLSAKECLAIVAGADGPQPMLSLPAPVNPSKRQLALADIDGDEGDQPPAPKRAARLTIMDIDGDEGPDDAKSSCSSSTSNSRSSSGSSSDGSHSIDGDFGDDDRPNVPKRICGRRTRLETHIRSGDQGLRITCGVHGHTCRKFRSIEKDRSLYGNNACEYFLATWLSLADTMPDGTHGKHTPTHAEIKAYILSL
jgi:hypothetical protein